jgi:hypothetical protein
MKNLLVLFSLLFSLPMFGALSNPRVGGMEVLPVHRGVVTVDTIADLIALSPTNMAYVKAYSGTNGLGGGLFELRGTNGYSTNTGTIFASAAARKFWFRQDIVPLNAEWFGAKHDGVTDDTVPLQKWLDMHTNGLLWSRLPLGDYKITSTLSVTGLNLGDGWRMSGDFGRPREPKGSRILWYGASGGTMMQLVGCNGSTIEHMVFNARSVAKFALTIDARNSEASNPSIPSSGVRLKGVTLSATVGAGSAALQYSHVSVVSPQISEITAEDCLFQGTTGSDYGVRSLGTGNTKNFSFYNCTFETFTNQASFLSGNGLIRFDNITVASCKTNILIAAGCNLEVTGWYDESSGFFLFQPPGGANRGSALISDVEWNGNTTATSGTNDVVIYVGSQVKIQTSSFRNARSASAIPIILVNSPFIADVIAARGDVISESSYYENATVPPMYGVDTGAGGYLILTNQWLFHRTGGMFSGTNVAAISMNDMGGTSGALIPFKSYDKTGGDRAVDYLEVFGSGVWNSNKLGVGTQTPTNTLQVHGRTTLDSNVWMSALATNASPVSFIGKLAGGEIVETAVVTAASGTNMLTQTNGVNVSAGSSGTVNWTTGVTGYVSGAVVHLGVSATGGSATALGFNTNATQVSTNFSQMTWTNVAGSGINFFAVSNANGIVIAWASVDTSIVVTQANLNAVFVSLSNLVVASSGGSAITPFVRIDDLSGIGGTNFSIGSPTNMMIDAQSHHIFAFTNKCNGCEMVLTVTNGGGYGISATNLSGTNHIEWEDEVPPFATITGDIGIYTFRVHWTATNGLGSYHPPRGTAVGSFSRVNSSGPISAGGSGAPSLEWTNAGTGFTHSMLYSNISMTRIDVYDMSTLWPVVVGTAYCWAPKATNGAGNVLWTNGPVSVSLNGAQPTNSALTAIGGPVQTGSYQLTNLLLMGFTNIVTIAGPTAGLGTNGGVLYFTNSVPAAGWGLTSVISGSTITMVPTNIITLISTSAASATVDFGDVANYQELSAWWHLTTNLVISPTNLVVGRTMKLRFPTNSLTYDITITNTAANQIRWNFNVATNGSTSVTKTNTMSARLFLTAETNGVISAEFGYYR